jgi:hypothetical protein
MSYSNDNLTPENPGKGGLNDRGCVIPIPPPPFTSPANLDPSSYQIFHPDGRRVVGGVFTRIGGDYLIPAPHWKGKKDRTALTPSLVGVTSYPPAQPEPAWDYWLEVDNSVRKSKWRKVYFDDE